MSKIEIRGIIVPSEFDGGWYQSLSDRGVITPESKFRRDLAGAITTEPLTVYLNTPGGSVFAGNEMVNAVRGWKAQTQQKINVVVGAMAASMGAAFVIQAADKVSVYQNSLMMFHGAWGVQVGGSEAMKDYSEVLGKINAATKSTLLTRYELKPEQIEEWFAEGREGWLTADEMKSAGIAQEIIGEDDEAMSLDGYDAKEFDAHGLKIAALVTGLEKIKQKGGKNVLEHSAAQAASSVAPAISVVAKHDSDRAVSGVVQAAPAGPSATESQSEVIAPSESCVSDINAMRELCRRDAAREFAEQKEMLYKRMSEAQENARKLQSERDKLSAEISKLSAQYSKFSNEMTEKLKLANDHVAKLLAGGLEFSPAPQTWEEAKQACGGDYVKAARAYPELKRAYNEQNKTK